MLIFQISIDHLSSYVDHRLSIEDLNLGLGHPSSTVEAGDLGLSHQSSTREIKGHDHQLGPTTQVVDWKGLKEMLAGVAGGKEIDLVIIILLVQEDV